MQIPFIDLKQQYKLLKNKLDCAYYEVMESGKFIQGEKCIQLEKNISTYYGVNNAIGVGNGTQALELTFKSLNFPPKSEIILPAYGWISTAHAIVQAGHQPVFVDIAANNFEMDLNRVGDSVNNKTKAIVPVHLYGEMSNLDKIVSLADMHDLSVIEDAAQAHGCKNIGKYSKAAILSFYPTKQLGAFGDAGMVLTEDTDLAKNIRKWANYGSDFPGRDYELPGTNSRLDELQSAFLMVKLEFLEKWIRRRRDIAAFYNKELGDLKELKLPAITSNHTFYLYSIRLEKREELRSYLREKAIETGQNYGYVIPHTSFYNRQQDFPNSKKAANTVLNLPCYPELTDEQIHYVCDAIKSYFRH